MSVKVEDLIYLAVPTPRKILSIIVLSTALQRDGGIG